MDYEKFYNDIVEIDRAGHQDGTKWLKVKALLINEDERQTSAKVELIKTKIDGLSPKVINRIREYCTGLIGPVKHREDCTAYNERGYSPRKCSCGTTCPKCGADLIKNHDMEEGHVTGVTCSGCDYRDGDA